ncbi:MAG: hypothetical protein M3Z35_17795, partial [Nitrospirota bacterium]|nr:hypothetical protein [Nitrospirota bacterium]
KRTRIRMLIAAPPHDSYLHTDLPPLLRHNPGVLIMTHRPLHLSYINVQARSIINKLHHLECGTFRRGLPNAVIAFCLDLLEALGDRCDTDMPAPFQLDRAIGLAGGSIVLRGLGMPRSSEVDESRICILMEERESERQGSSFV